MADALTRTRAGDDRRLAALQRDAALTRISRVRRGLIVATAALTAGVAALVSAITPGRSSGAVRAASSSVAAVSSGASHGSSLTMPAPAGPSELGLQGPGQAPQAAPAPSSAPPPDNSSSQAQPSAPTPSGGAVSGGS